MKKNLYIIILFLISNNVYAETKLFIKTIPENAKVQILNINTNFKQGIDLKKGKYRVLVKSKDFVTKRFIVTISKKPILRLKVNLLPKKFTNSIGMEFVYIKPGTFMMGSPSDEPGRVDREPRFKVTLTKGFYMQTTEVSEGQYKALMGYNPSRYQKGNDYPVESVSWNDANKFIRYLKKRERTRNYRLPTEAEWEYACRAGTTTPFSFGNCINSNQVVFYAKKPYGKCKTSPRSKHKHPIKSLIPNRWGLYNMHGNVKEWCLDYWGIPTTEKKKKNLKHKSYYKLLTPFKSYREDYVNKIKSPFKVSKGGHYSMGAAGCRSAWRARHSPESNYFGLGFRVVKEIIENVKEINEEIEKKDR